jgi:hypothetical protein
MPRPRVQTRVREVQGQYLRAGEGIDCIFVILKEGLASMMASPFLLRQPVRESIDGDFPIAVFRLKPGLIGLDAFPPAKACLLKA